jgi:addiction module HigA family antidote
VILQKDFLDAMGLSRYRLARETGIPESRLYAIVHGKQGISADTAHRLSKYFGTSPELWMGLQSSYDLEEAEKKSSESYSDIQPLAVILG